MVSTCKSRVHSLQVCWAPHPVQQCTSRCGWRLRLAHELEILYDSAPIAKNGENPRAQHCLSGFVFVTSSAHPLGQCSTFCLHISHLFLLITCITLHLLLVEIVILEKRHPLKGWMFRSKGACPQHVFCWRETTAPWLGYNLGFACEAGMSFLDYDLQ